MTKTVEFPNRVTLPYVEHGDPAGLPVLFVHGFAGSLHDFEQVLATLPLPSGRSR